MKPLFSYYGGKQRMSPHILPLVEAIPHTVYCEAFAGGASLLFAKNKKLNVASHNYREVLNDTNNLVWNFYRTAKLKRVELVSLIDATPYSQAAHKKAQEICDKPELHDDLTVAWAFFVNIEMSFSKTLGAGWRTSVISQNAASVWSNTKSRLDEGIARIEHVFLGHEDALDCIRRWDSPQTLFYLDPPYPNANQGHYGGYTLEHWENLCNLLDTIEGSYVLSNYPQPIEPKSAQKRVEIEATLSASKGDREKRTEIVWLCDRSHAMRNDLKPLVERVGLFSEGVL